MSGHDFLGLIIVQGYEAMKWHMQKTNLHFDLKAPQQVVKLQNVHPWSESVQHLDKTHKKDKIIYMYLCFAFL